MAFSGLAMKNKARMQYWNEHSALRRWEFQMLCHLRILTFQWCSLNPLISLAFLSASVNRGIWAKVTLSSLLTITNRFQGIYSLYIHYINRFFFLHVVIKFLISKAIFLPFYPLLCGICSGNANNSNVFKANVSNTNHATICLNKL